MNKLNYQNTAIILPAYNEEKAIAATIEDFYQYIQFLYPTDWDMNPENYILDENTNTVKVVDLGDLYFEDSI